MNAPDYLGRHGAPKPPPEIWRELEAAGATGDDIRLGIARARYTAWLADQGIHEHPHGTNRPDGAIR